MVAALEDLPTRRWYRRQRWRVMRAEQLRAKPLCERCQGRGHCTPATVVHHSVPHKRDQEIFFDSSILVSLCSDCHDVDEQRIERGGKARSSVDEFGWPLDKK